MTSPGRVSQDTRSQEAGSRARSASMSGGLGRSDSGYIGSVGSPGSRYEGALYLVPRWEPRTIEMQLRFGSGSKEIQKLTQWSPRVGMAESSWCQGVLAG